MSSGWSIYVMILTLLSFAAILWLLFSNLNKSSTGEELDHEFDGIYEVDNPLPAWWVMMFIATIIFGLGYVFYYPALGNLKGAGDWSSVKEWLHHSDQHEERFSALYKNYATQSVDQLTNDQRAMQTGRRLFLNYCATCHGVTAQGSVGFPNLTDSEWIWGGDFEQIKQSISSGRSAVMPPWGQILKPEQLSAVSQYILSESKASSATNSEGAEVYASYCVACHGADAKGINALGAPDLSDKHWLYGGTIESITESIANGRQGQMPPQGDILGDDKVHLLAAYIYSLKNKGASVNSAQSQ